jgi:hypothetical protein
MTIAGPVAGPGPVEIPDQRADTVTAFRHPDGARTVVLSSGPIRLRRGTSWLPVDLTLHRDPDGAIRPAAHPDTLWLSGGGRPADAAAVRGPDGSNIALPWNAPLPAPKLTGNRAVYPNARPGADLVIEATRTGYVASLESTGGAPGGRIPRSPSAKPAPAAVTHAPAAASPAPAALPTTANPAPAPASPSVPPPAVAEPAPPSVLPPTPIAEAPTTSPAAPTPAGSTGPAAPAGSAALAGAPLTLRVTRPAGAPATDPATGAATSATADSATGPAAGPATDGQPSAATELMAGPPGSPAARSVVSRVVANTEGAGQATLPFGTTVQSTVTSADLSGDPDLKLGSYDGHSAARAYLSWDLSRLRGQKVMAATLRLYADWSSSCRASGWEVWSSPPVGPATRWANQPAAERAWASSTATLGHDAHCQPGWTSVNLTDLVKSWVAAGATSGTVQLRATNESDPASWKRFSSGAGEHVPALGVTLSP